MKYFLIAGEASGDLHAAHLMKALCEADPEASFRYYGGDCMQAVGGTLLAHYRDLAYMGFVQVALHLRTILRGMSRCRQAIAEWRPDAVILVDYPGFNLKMARFVKQQRLCPVFYYISPKIWAWKEHRIGDIRRTVDRLFSILPFEVDFFERKHHYPISYVGNPTVDEVAAYVARHGQPRPDGRTIALLPGSRRQEINDNLSRMLEAVKPLCTGPQAEAGWMVRIAAAPAIPRSFYSRMLQRAALPEGCVELVEGDTYRLLSHATAALVTSGTATLETALFGVPQVVCYYMRCGWLVSRIRPYFLKVPFISLVNLIAGREVVAELVADGMTAANARRHLTDILPGTPGREAMLQGYADMAARLGEPGAPARAAAEMVAWLNGRVQQGRVY